MKSIEDLKQAASTFTETCRQEFGLACAIAVGSIALANMARPNPDPRDVAAYNNARTTELELYGIAAKLQQGGNSTRAEANAIDKLGQRVSGARGELEDKLAEDTNYFDEDA